ncbi:allene oxide cyclase [Marchantia polymorpha subsp. ruderalis]|nr:hypothetical protein MARPO_0057s0049 [Marchantia polymorpha]BAO93687.1 allene oxide cyclase [Marchantia polymorpha]BBN16430.1 hypothetical protein Mp_7g06220 [Marchantia polymorpha subsp. ruderalis]|eukprot:PTQ37412.1 hypothetical protein MARPO_0057s0049 [Marchantia polymorpha]
MAASIQAAAAGLSFIAPASQPPCNSSQGSNASRQSVGGPVKSHFFGSARALGNVGSSKHLTPATAGANPIVSASFFEKLGKLFTDAPEDQEQVMGVFEFNEGDRNSPFVVKNNAKLPVLCIGDFVPYSNKVYDCTGKKYLGISSGLCTVVEHHYESGGDLYETVMSHYMGSYGHLSCQGPYKTYGDTEMVVTGGTGIFKGARGYVKCHNIAGPLKLLYTYYLTGIPKLPSELTQTPAVLDEEKKTVNSTVASQKVKA